MKRIYAFNVSFAVLVRARVHGMLSRRYMVNDSAKPLVLTLLAAAMLLTLAACGKKEALSRPDFPLSEEAVTAALEEMGLSWSIEQADEVTVGTTKSIIYSLYRPDSEVDYNTFFINAFDSEEYGRRLQIYFHVPPKDVWQKDDARWENWWETEDWQASMALAVRLYGGFEDAEEITRACSAAETTQDGHVLLQETLTGGYCHISARTSLQSWQPSEGTTVALNIYESEKAYQDNQQAHSELKRH